MVLDYHYRDIPASTIVIISRIIIDDMEKRTRRVLAENVRKLRKYRKYSQEELGRRARIGQSTVHEIEKPDGKSIGIDNIEAVAHALGIDTYHLLIPDAPIDVLQNRTIESIVSSSCAADQEGRANIARIAENEERYSMVKKSSSSDAKNASNG